MTGCRIFPTSLSIFPQFWSEHLHGALQSGLLLQTGVRVPTGGEEEAEPPVEELCPGLQGFQGTRLAWPVWLWSQGEGPAEGQDTCPGCGLPTAQRVG